MSTIGPLATALALPVKERGDISQDEYELGNARVAKVVRKALERGSGTVLCSHGPVLPEIIAELARQTNTPVDGELRRSAMLSTGEYSVFHIAVDIPDGGVVAIETHAPAAE